MPVNRAIGGFFMMFYDALCGEDWIKAGFMDWLLALDCLVNLWLSVKIVCKIVIKRYNSI